EWFGLTCLIGDCAAFLPVQVLLLTVQSRLRGDFERLLQHAANSRAAVHYWKQKSVAEIRRLDADAQKWKSEMEERRRLHAERMTSSVDQRIAELTSLHHEQLGLQADQSASQIAALDSSHAREQMAVESWRTSELTRIKNELARVHDAAVTEERRRVTDQRQSLQREREEVLQDWNKAMTSAEEIANFSRDRNQRHRRLSELRPSNWNPATVLPQDIPIGHLLATIPDPPHSTESQEGSRCLEIPAMLRFPTDTSLVIEHDAAGRETALDFVRAILLRLLAEIMPGRVQVTLIDPVGLGQSFSAMMHLADYDELLISNRIWTDPSQIRDRLQKVTEHMESVFQTYLRSEFETIEDYNRAAGEVAEPYHFVVVAGFPSGFSEEAAKSLTSILTSGPRCGVHAIVTWSPDQGVPRSFDVANFQTGCTAFHVLDGQIQPGVLKRVTESLRRIPRREGSGIDEMSELMERSSEEQLQDARGVLFEAVRSPESNAYVNLVRAIGEKSKDARRVEVSFSRIAPKADRIWTHSSADGIDFPIGRAGAARLQYMRLGRGTSQHVLIAGKTGSGKSTLLHILITNLALHYSPEEIQFYLIDFKKGVEFRTYAANKLPHAKVVAIESDREFGLSVLERLDEVLQERGELFRVRGVQDVPSFRRQFPGQRMPRLMLLIDEFQEFFTSEDRVSSRASLLLDRLIRQGRAFGIHVLLGSQTLGGAYSLARSTLGQVAVRIALQCSEGDAHLILSEENSAARLLTRPGEAIYNDANGLVEGNHPFQIAWLDEEKRESMIHEMIQRSDYIQKSDGRMIVFEGNVPPVLEQCGPLAAWLSSEPDATRHFIDSVPAWIGEPVSIAAPVSLEFRRTGGQNVIIVGQEGDLADAILASTIVSWCAGEHTPARPRTSRMILLHDGRDRSSEEKFRSLFTADIVPRFELRSAIEADRTVADLSSELAHREHGDAPPDSPEIIFAIRNIGQFRSLRKDEEDFGLGMGSFGSPKEATPATQLGDLIRRGPAVGIHVIVWSDTFGNAMRWLSNSLLREFDNRIAFRLNQTDSASLIDTPTAASLTQGRAILYRDQTGVADRFRPFSWPSADWLRHRTMTSASFVSSTDITPPAEPDVDLLTSLDDLQIE
ncbi:MAG: FtsK/SpoIIIE domain-containing protein, partial [Planctomycetota bacterium]